MSTIAHTFGDSITAGYGLSSTGQRWSSVLCAKFGYTEDNQSQSSTSVNDNACSLGIPNTTIGTTDLSFWLAGYNDQATFGTAAGALSDARESLRSLLARLAIPTTLVKKYNDSAITYAGTWSNIDGALGGFKYGQTVGCTATVTVSGTSVYVGLVRGSVGGTVSIVVDGGTPIAYSCASSGPQSIVDHNTSCHGAVLVSGLTAGTHTVVVTVTSGVGFLSSVAGYTASPGPKVCIGGVLSMREDEYPNTPGGSDLAVETWTQMILDIVLTLQTAGLDVSHALVKVDTAGEVQSDKIHPNAAGATRIARQMFGGMFASFDAVFPAAADTRTGVTYGRRGSDTTGTLVLPSGGLTTDQAAQLQTIATEIIKVPRVGSTHRYSRAGVTPVDVTVAEVT